MWPCVSASFRAKFPKRCSGGGWGVLGALWKELKKTDWKEVGWQVTEMYLVGTAFAAGYLACQMPCAVAAAAGTQVVFTFAKAKYVDKTKTDEAVGRALLAVAVGLVTKRAGDWLDRQKVASSSAANASSASGASRNFQYTTVVSRVVKKGDVTILYTARARSSMSAGGNSVNVDGEWKAIEIGGGASKARR